MDLHKEIEDLKVKSGYSGKPQQWQYGFDLACRELAKAQAVPDGFVLVSIDDLAGAAQNIRELNIGEYYSEEIEENVCAIETML